MDFPRARRWMEAGRSSWYARTMAQTSPAPRAGFKERQRAYVTRCRPEDHAAVTAFRQAMYGKGALAATAAVTEWYARLPGGGSPLWVFRRSGAIEGHQVVVPTPVWIGGREVSGAFGTDLIVTPALRNVGIGSILTEVTLGDVPLAYGLEVSDAAAPALARMGWLDLGTLPLYVAVLRPGAFVRARLRASPRRAEASLAAGVFDAPFAALATGTAAVQRLRGLALRPVRRFDDRVRGIWERSAPRYPAIVERTAARLNWAFADFPRAGRYRLFLLERRGEAVAYAVLRAEVRHGEAVAVLVDFLAAPEDLVDLARCASAWAHREGACALYAVGSSRACVSWRRAGMLRRDSGWRAMVAPRGLSAEDRAVVGDAGSWFFTGGDANLDRPREGVVYAG